MRPASFSRYGYCEDTGMSNNYWVSTISQFHGPFHSNGTNTANPSVPNKIQVQWDPTANAATQYIFDDEVSSCASSVAYTKSTGGSAGPVTDAEFAKIYVKGKKAITLGADAIPFPTVSTLQRDYAWGGDNSLDASIPKFPDPNKINTATTVNPKKLDATVINANTGVFVQQNRPSGIYIVPGREVGTNYSNYTTKKIQPPAITFSKTANDCEQVVDIDHTVVDVATATWVQRTTRITQNLVNNTTIVATKTGTETEFTTTQTLTRVTNGVIFCTNNIGIATVTSAELAGGGISGVLVDSYLSGGKIVRANNWTVSTDFAAGKNILITNNLTYLHEPISKDRTTGADVSKTDPLNLRCAALGLVAKEIFFKALIAGDTNYDASNPAYAAHTDIDLIINGVLMAIGGQIKALDSGVNLRGKLFVTGGTIVKSAAMLGTFKTVSGKFVVETGFFETYSYDPRMADGPLTAFPSTNQYAILSWQCK